MHSLRVCFLLILKGNQIMKHLYSKKPVIILQLNEKKKVTESVVTSAKLRILHEMPIKYSIESMSYIYSSL